MPVKPDIQLRSRKMRLIIGKMPPYLIRISTSIVFIVFCLLFVLAYFIPYKTTFKGNAVFTSQDSLAHFLVLIPENHKNELNIPTEITLIPQSSTIKIKTIITQIKDTIYFHENSAWHQAVAKVPLPIKSQNGKYIQLSLGSRFVVVFTSKESSLFQRLFGTN